MLSSSGMVSALSQQHEVSNVAELCDAEVGAEHAYELGAFVGLEHVVVRDDVVAPDSRGEGVERRA